MAGTLPNIAPTRSSSKATETRVLIADLGDGYTQRAGDGINTLKEMWSVEYTCLDQTNANELIGFLEDQGGYLNFTWTPPGESEELKYICKTWSVSHQLGNSKKILNAEFEQVFDL